MSRRPRLRSGLVLGLLLLPLFALGSAQSPSPQDSSVERQLAQLERQLAETERPIRERKARLEAALRQFGTRLELGKRLQLELRLAVFELALRKPKEARQLFERLLRRIVQHEQLPQELHARCRLGLAQARELAGETRDANRLYREVTRRWPSTRYERVARMALRRLRSEPGTWPEGPLPLLQQARRIDGERIQPPSASAWLVVFLADRSGDWPPALQALGTESEQDSRARGVLRVTAFVPADERGARSVRRKLQKLASRPQVQLEVVPWPERLEERVQEELGFATLPLWCLLDRQSRVRRILPSAAEIRAAR
jgi:hypothetical protein